MGVRLDGDIIRLEGDCAVDEAEVLLTLLQTAPARMVDLSLCRHPHAAVVQVLLGFAGGVRGVNEDAFIERWLTPALIRAVADRPDVGL